MPSNTIDTPPKDFSHQPHDAAEHSSQNTTNVPNAVTAPIKKAKDVYAMIGKLQDNKPWKGMFIVSRETDQQTVTKNGYRSERYTASSGNYFVSVNEQQQNDNALQHPQPQNLLQSSSTIPLQPRAQSQPPMLTPNLSEYVAPPTSLHNDFYKGQVKDIKRSLIDYSQYSANTLSNTSNITAVPHSKLKGPHFSVFPQKPKHAKASVSKKKTTLSTITSVIPQKPKHAKAFVSKKKTTLSTNTRLDPSFAYSADSLNDRVYVKKAKIETTFWGDKNTLVYQVVVGKHTLSRRSDNNYINGTKLLNTLGLTRGRRDGILKAELVKDIVVTGNLQLKGVWIPLKRAYEIARNGGIESVLFPLFIDDIDDYFIKEGHKLKCDDPILEISTSVLTPGGANLSQGVLGGITLRREQFNNAVANFNGQLNGLDGVQNGTQYGTQNDFNGTQNDFNSHEFNGQDISSGQNVSNAGLSGYQDVSNGGQNISNRYRSYQLIGNQNISNGNGLYHDQHNLSFTQTGLIANQNGFYNDQNKYQESRKHSNGDQSPLNENKNTITRTRHRRDINQSPSNGIESNNYTYEYETNPFGTPSGGVSSVDDDEDFTL